MNNSYNISYLVDKQILVAEDNKLNQKLITKILEDAGCVLSHATNGEEAIEFAEKIKFDAILMDVQMPLVDGLEAAQKITTQSQLNTNTPIIAMTAHSLQSDINKCYTAGMVNYVAKPFNLHHLMGVLTTEIQKSIDKIKMKTYANQQDKNAINDTSTAQIDLQFLNQLAAGNSDFINDFFKIYVEEVSSSLLKMELPIADTRVAEIKGIVHHLKPTLEMIGLLALKKQIETFEQGELTAASANELITSIKPVIEDSLATIKSMMVTEDL